MIGKPVREQALDQMEQRRKVVVGFARGSNGKEEDP